MSKVNLIVNVNRYPEIANKLDINVSGLSRQLPTAILFKNCKEVRRFPSINEEGKIGKVLKFDEKALEHYFQLRDILYDLCNRDK